MKEIRARSCSPLPGEPRLIFALILLLFIPGSLIAFSPGKWSPLDVYVLKGRPGGPQVIEHRIRGEITLRARLSYDANGRLIREVYEKPTGKKTGERSYLYSRGRLIRETLSDAKGKKLETRFFDYDGNGLKSMQIKNSKNQIIMTQSLTSQEYRVLSGKEVVGKIMDVFRIEYDNNRPKVIRVFNDSGKELGKVSFGYRPDGNVAHRIREQNSNLSRCVYEYDSSGKLKSYSYFTRDGKHWVHDKTLNLIY